jgi:CRISPR type III-A-associated protein Csm2
MDIEEVKRRLKEIDKLRNLKAEDYAIENGLADQIASAKKEKFTQIRKFFGHIKKIESTKIKGRKDDEKISKEDIYILMPELAYNYGRNVISKEFYEIMKICLTGNKIESVADFKKFIDFLSAIIAYRKMRE